MKEQFFFRSTSKQLPHKTLKKSVVYFLFKYNYKKIIMKSRITVFSLSALTPKKWKFFVLHRDLAMKSGYTMITLIVEHRWNKLDYASILVAKSNISCSKLLHYIEWNQLGEVYYEQLKLTETISGGRYRLQLMSLWQALKKTQTLSSKNATKLFCNMTM